MDNKDLADLLVNLLNGLIKESDAVRKDVGKLIDARVVASQETINHSTIVVGDNNGLGVLGLLNGLVGGGYIAAVYDDDGSLLHFIRRNL